jgi:CheY-specific phosphatase CheX
MGDNLSKVMRSVLRRTEAHLQAEYDVTCVGVETALGNYAVLALREVTVIVALGGTLNILVVMSFELTLLFRLFSVDTADMIIKQDEQEIYIRETAVEFANIILGHCLADLEEYGMTTSLSPPVVIHEPHNIHRPDNAMFARISLTTDVGAVEIDFVGSRELFDEPINVSKGKES